ncbi:RNA polymerase sigma factor [Fodinibius halophilus]|uniref:Sigma-70 family RNA polymerase sigma factor n=1 Tax=Fodinibius halophilus TaxID=1736908 RepID=A0A6M1TC72_9BACT|nr:sigma-70 family RNA polymerase sigma factor [Fodinibius halophilus]NGP89963.1 sigma-70 family RNA polymerase sigma factor [Fodinibius halophilus]
MEQQKEWQLIEKIQNGQSGDYRTLVDRYAPMVFSIVNNFVDAEADREELAQAIFVKAYERLDTFKGNSKFSSWLYSLAKNHCRDYAKNIRRNNSNFSEMDEQDLNSRLRDDGLPDEAVEQQQWIALLQAGLDHINDDYAEAFMMKYNGNMSYKAMSKRLDASVSALKVRVYRAKKELKNYIENRS